MNPFYRYTEGELLTPDLFREMCNAHDTTFSDSDDIRVWRKGRKELDTIEEAAAKLGRDVAKPIWNNSVRKKLTSPYQEYYIWKGYYD